MNTTDQSARWNGPSGQAWVQTQALMDESYRQIEHLLVDDIAPGTVLDVGCGTGSTTVAAAGRVGTAGRVTGVDISGPMIAAARARAEQAGVDIDLIEADAQDHPFEPGTYDTVMSRFGVMFFADPERAFANLRRATAADGRLRLVVWRDVSENPFMTTAERAAAHLVDIPPRRPGQPGQFGLADPARLTDILRGSGWSDIDLHRADVPCTFPESELVGYFTRFGPLAQVLPDADDETRAKVVDTVRSAFDPFVHGPEVRFTAACWLVTARAAG